MVRYTLLGPEMLSYYTNHSSYRRGQLSERGDSRRFRARGGFAHDPGDHQLLPRQPDQEQLQPDIHAIVQERAVPTICHAPYLSGS